LGPDHPDVIKPPNDEVDGPREGNFKANDGTSDLARQTRGHGKVKLAKVKEKYAPEHPDVIRLTRQVEELRKAVGGRPWPRETSVKGQGTGACR